MVISGSRFGRARRRSQRLGAFLSRQSIKLSPLVSNLRHGFRSWVATPLRRSVLYLDGFCGAGSDTRKGRRERRKARGIWASDALSALHTECTRSTANPRLCSFCRSIHHRGARPSKRGHALPPLPLALQAAFDSTRCSSTWGGRRARDESPCVLAPAEAPITVMRPSLPGTGAQDRREDLFWTQELPISSALRAQVRRGMDPIRSDALMKLGLTVRSVGSEVPDAVALEGR